MSVHHVYAVYVVPVEARRGWYILWMLQMVVRYYVGAGDGTGPVEEQPNFSVPSQSTF